jgi:hypothetical protein
VKKWIIAVQLGLGALALDASAAVTSLWRDVRASAIPLAGPRLIQPRKLRTFAFDVAALRATLQRAPHESSTAARPTLALPMPDGTTLSFAIAESPVMEPGLAAKYPQIRTYAGRATTDPAISGRFDFGPRGFHGQVFTPQGTVYIDPFSRGDVRHHQVYYRGDSTPRSRPADAVLPKQAPRAPDGDAPLLPGTGAQRGVSIDGNLLTYRLALAANGEYSMFHDPQALPALPRKEVVLAEMVNVVNRVTGVYERELGIRLVLIANNDLLIFQNSEADPYKNDDPTQMWASNTAVIDGIVGPTAYDIGHVATTGGGGVAGLGVVCTTGFKGQGVTGLPQPIGDEYYIDFVAHEMGHQFGGNHTFNGTTGSCAGNANTTTGFEPGSGVTIMAYAGICVGQNVAPHSIDTFHAVSFDEMVAYTRESDGNTCGTVTTVSNRAPVVTVPAGDPLTIPKQTPFELTGSATDPDGDALTFQWEEMDLGTPGHPNDAATVTGSTPPLFRSFLPSSSPTRIFPQLSDLVDDAQTLGEILPAVTRKMDFRLTVRDNRVAPSAGGVASADYRVNVTAAAGPFQVTHPHAQTAYYMNEPMDVRWLVAGTTAAPVSCPAVDILLSTDKGQTFPTMLADDTPNDGAETVTITDVVPGDTLLKVKCSNNIFFALSTENFLQGIQPPVLSVGADYEDPDSNGVFTLSWVRPETGVGPDTLQHSASCGPVFTDDAEETLLAGANSKWSGSAQWTSQQNGGSLAYFIPDGSSQAEALSLIDPIDIPEGAVSKMTFRTAQSLEDGYDFGRVRINVDETGFKTIALWTGNFTGTRTVDLSPYAGHSIRVEFLMLSDEFNEAVPTGWYVDDIAITATVFQDLVTVPGTSHTIRAQPVGNYCYRARTTHFIEGQTGVSAHGNIVDVAVATTNRAPIALAGADRSVDEGAADVGLHGSWNDDGGVLTYHWEQLSGPPVTLARADTGDASFTAPLVSADTPLEFRFTVTDELGNAGSDTVVITVRNVGSTGPSAFTFTVRNGVASGVYVTSETRTITGFDGSLPITIDTGAQYRINNGSWTGAPGSVVSGSTLTVRHVSASTPSTEKVSTVTVGSYATPFRSVTAASDRTPDAFDFGSKAGVAPGAVVESDARTPAGYNVAIALAPGPGLSYRIGAGEWQTGSGTLQPGQSLQVRHTASATPLQYTRTYLKVGTHTAYFTTRTQ